MENSSKKNKNNKFFKKIQLRYLFIFYCFRSFNLYTENTEISSAEFFGTDILGYWITNEKVGSEAIIELKRNLDTFEYYGVIAYIGFPEEGKKKVPILTEDPLIKTKIIYGFKYNYKNKKYLGGRVLDPTNGNIYYARLRVDNSGKLVLRGSLDPWSILGANRKWERVNPADLIKK